jgi:mRNA-degrading endonuclease YafQ of YafQ-DinJ toxin-antitoxin module
MMKKIIGIAFLVILLLQVSGSYVYFIVRLSGIRQEMREQLKDKADDELTLLTFTHDEFKIKKADDHEVKVNGKMYDIARVEVKGDQVLVYALHDEAEDNLLTLLNEMVKRSEKDKKPVPHSLLHLITLQFVVFENVSPKIFGIWINHITSYRACIRTFNTPIETPPPRG